MRAKKLLDRTHHEYGPRGWHGLLSREDAEEVGGTLAQQFADHAPRGGDRHTRLMRVLTLAQKSGDHHVTGEEARTLMSAFRLSYNGVELRCANGEIGSLAKRSRISGLCGAFSRTFRGNSLFDVEEVAL